MASNYKADKGVDSADENDFAKNPSNLGGK